MMTEDSLARITRELYQPAVLRNMQDTLQRHYIMATVMPASYWWIALTDEYILRCLAEQALDDGL